MATVATVTVLNLAGDTVATVPVTDSLTILELKTRLGPPHLVELTWEGRALSDTDTATKLAWPPHVTLHLVMRAVDCDTPLELLRHDWAEAKLDRDEYRRLLLSVQDLIQLEPMVLELEPPVAISSNFCGDMAALNHVLNIVGEPPETQHLLLGNYVNRGRNSLKVLQLLLCYKHKYPSKIYLLRRQNECMSIGRIYGFYDECKRVYDVRFYKACTNFFNHLPVVALIRSRIFCVSSGLSPELRRIEQLADLPKRPIDVPDHGLLCDLLWADPDTGIKGWGEMDKGVSYIFGTDVVEQFLSENSLDLIVRGSQIVEEGYEFFCGGKLVTIFSSPNYIGEFHNKASVMLVDADLQHRFITYTDEDAAVRRAVC